ncbi:SAM-dependent methyltransferase [Chromatium okenii]|uniref:class I SAM-dependent DNA methyltransferase n=1 Tax=Chromatium okenii TaxID=61644 RepID=UPI001908BC3F|nr:DNA methyltransferase [Chromatium okenii]MBK1640916.1 SAM-dependent methyltransferase [Chromatium okenii]
MTPEQFITKWQITTLKERSAAQEHFIDLCRLLNEPTPAEVDPTGAFYCFERGAKKVGGGDGWADVWKKDCFGWEYKGKRKNLAEALKQLQLYTPSLLHPPLLIVSDMEQIIIYTAFPGTVPDEHRITLEELRNPAQLQLLKWAFSEPERLRPTRTTAALTEAAARRFGELAAALCQRGHAPLQVAQFSQQLLFCFFAQDIGLLPNKVFTNVLDAGQQRPAYVLQMLENLLNTMATGGCFGTEPIAYFNGGLFRTTAVLPLTVLDIKTLRELAEWKWSAIEPSIFGTLFERGLDPNQREQLGAHYTDAAAIMRIVNPVVLEPLRAEWTATKTAVTQTKSRKAAQALFTTLLERLRNFRVLDPACGSGNFLFLALKGLKDLEHEIILEAERLHFQRSFPAVGPENVLGIETNAYAAELARVTVWIGELQWMIQHGFSLANDPILKPIKIIAHRDAVLNENGTEAEWPSVDVIIGNPPFLGGSKKRSVLGDEYFTALKTIYAGRVPAGADLVTYWFEKARTQIESGKAQAAGLVTTNSIRGGANRKVLERICETTTIFNAWSDEPWINSGAAVRVSIICFGNTTAAPVLNDKTVAAIYADLTAKPTTCAADLTTAHALTENAGVSFRGSAKVGKFDISGTLARQWLMQPNPHQYANSDVLCLWANGMDIVRRPSDTWIIDFGVNTTEINAAMYEMPYEHVLKAVKPLRAAGRRAIRKKYWWRLGETVPALRRAFEPIERYIASPMVAKFRLFVWLNTCVFPDQQLIVIARADDTTFGILHSRCHELWSLRMGTSLGATPRYTPTTTFETFPFPIGLTPADTKGETIQLDSGAMIPSVATEYQAYAITIAQAAFEFNRLRDNWLNPPEWIERVPEVVPGYPERIVAKPEFAAQLKTRTLTNLYNNRPTWLINAQQQLDCAVAAAYGWSHDITDADILQRLLALNQCRSKV